MRLHVFIAGNAKIAVFRVLKPCMILHLFVFQVYDSFDKPAQRL
jgi:hypothetical protein